MDAVLLVGGLGTRLRRAVPDLPKPLAPIQGTPFLDLLLTQLAATGLIEKAILAVGYRKEQIIDYYRKKPSLLPVEFSSEEEPLGTGGALKLALKMTNSEWVVVLNGDSYVEFSLPDMLTYGKNVLATTFVEDASRFGKLVINEELRVISFQEKSSLCEPGWINAGVYLLHRSILDAYPESSYFSLEKDLFPHCTLYACPTKGTFIDIGTTQSFKQAQEILSCKTF